MSKLTLLADLAAAKHYGVDNYNDCNCSVDEYNAFEAGFEAGWKEHKKIKVTKIFVWLCCGIARLISAKSLQSAYKKAVKLRMKRFGQSKRTAEDSFEKNDSILKVEAWK